MIIIDADRDIISVDPSHRFPQGSFITVTDHRNGEYGSVALERDDAVRVATEMLSNAGLTTVPMQDVKRASEVSFNEAMLRVACAHDRTVRFRYAKDDGKYIEARTLEPESFSANGEAVVGNDPDRGAKRAFRLDRIKGEVDFA